MTEADKTKLSNGYNAFIFLANYHGASRAVEIMQARGWCKSTLRLWAIHKLSHKQPMEKRVNS